MDGAGCSVDRDGCGAVSRSVEIIGAVGAANGPLGKSFWSDIVCAGPREPEIFGPGCRQTVGSDCRFLGTPDRGLGGSISASASSISRIIFTSSGGATQGRERGFRFRSVLRGDSSIWCFFLLRASFSRSGRSFRECLPVWADGKSRVSASWSSWLLVSGERRR